MEILGIDIGGTGIKGAPVNVDTGELTGERFRLPTPPGATPEGVSTTVAQVVEHFGWKGTIGCGFPAAIRGGQVLTAANVSKDWIGENALERFETATGCSVTVVNDADAAGYAEMRFGAGQGRDGLILIATLGTGIGTALFINGQLVPNTELGHIEIDGKDAETRAAASVRERKGLSWKKWAGRLDEYLQHMERYFWPDLIILGGGVSKKPEKFLHLLTVETEVVVAQMRNEAGIVGAALAALSSPKRTGSTNGASSPASAAMTAPVERAEATAAPVAPAAGNVAFDL